MHYPRLWLGTGLLLTATAATLGVAATFRNYNDIDELIQALAAVLTITVTAAAWLWGRAYPPKVRQLSLEQATDELAEELRRQWERAAAEQGLVVPAPIPIRWKRSTRGVGGPVTETLDGTRQRPSRFAPLPGVPAITRDKLNTGTLYDLFHIYSGLSSGRLIILGDPGAGKSGAAILLLLEALAHRAKLTAEDRRRVPVPVLVTPQGWDPTAEPFSKWLATRLARDYALLQAPEYGEDAALRLIEGGYLAVILDGLDEMPQALHPDALCALDEQATFRLVVLSRSEDLVAAVKHAHARLRGAAAIELMAMDAEQEAHYLASCEVDPLPPRWQHLINHLRECCNGVLAQALNTPLTLTLVRDTYGRGLRIDELIDGYIHDSTSGSKEVIEEHLLDHVVTAAYTTHRGRPIVPFTVEQARRWLGKLARQMNEERTNNLTWWRIPDWAPAWPRAFATILVMSVAGALIVPLVMLAIIFASHMSPSLAFGEEPLVATLTASFGKTLGFAFMFGPGLLLTFSPFRTPSARSDRPPWSKNDILVIFLAGLGVGLGYGLEKGLSDPKRGTAIGLVCSVVVGLGFLFAVGPPQQLGWLRWASTDTRTNLRTGLLVGLIAGLVTGLGYGFGRDFKHGLGYGLVVATGYLLVIVVGGRSSRQRRQPQYAIDVPTVLLIGLVIAVASGVAGYGIAYILTVIFAGRVPRLRSQLRWSPTATPKTLLSGLLAGSALGLAFGLTTAIPQWPNKSILAYGVALSLAFGLMVGLLLGLKQPPTDATNPLDPQSLWRHERRFGLGFGLMAGLMYGLLASPTLGLRDGILYGVTAGLMIGIGSGLVSSVTWAVWLTSRQLRRRDETPTRLLWFLDDARKRQILRMVGSVYRFRHAELQDSLARAYRDTPQKITIPYPRSPIDDTHRESRSSDDHDQQRRNTSF